MPVRRLLRLPPVAALMGACSLACLLPPSSIGLRNAGDIAPDSTRCQVLAFVLSAATFRAVPLYRSRLRRHTCGLDGRGMGFVVLRAQRVAGTGGADRRAVDRAKRNTGYREIYVNRAGGPGTTDEALLDQLFRSHGDGTFEAVSGWLSAPQRQGVSWSAVWSDLDLDDDPDLFVANADQATAGPSLLLENGGPDGADWLFVDRSTSCFCTDDVNPMGVSSADYEHDGDFDLYLTNTASDQLLENDGGLAFVDVSRTIGDLDLPTTRHMTFGAVWTDLDSDGWPDIFVSAGPLADGPDPELDAQPDRLLMNDGGTRLVDRAAALGVDNTGIGRGVTRAMLDDDGHPELVTIHLDGPSHIWKADCLAHRTLVVELRQGAGNTRGIGARVTLSFEDAPTQVQEVSAKPGRGGTMEPRAWFGLGSHTPRTLTVRWPDGVEEAYAVPPEADGRVRIER